MRIGIIGSGNIGGAAAKLFTKAGHEVALSHKAGPASLRDQVAALGPRACAMTVEEAAGFGDVVLLAIPWRNRQDLPAERLRGKIVIDAMNPFRPDHGLYDLGDSTSSEEVAKTTTPSGWSRRSSRRSGSRRSTPAPSATAGAFSRRAARCSRASSPEPTRRPRSGAATRLAAAAALHSSREIRLVAGRTIAVPRAAPGC